MPYTYIDSLGRNRRYKNETVTDSWRVFGDKFGRSRRTNYEYETYVLFESGKVLYEISDFYIEAQRAWEWVNGIEPGYSLCGGDFDLYGDSTYGLWVNALGWVTVYDDVNKFLDEEPGWCCDVQRKQTLTPEDNPVSWALFRSL